MWHNVTCLCLFGDCFVQICCCVLAQKTPSQKTNHNVAPPVKKKKKIHKTWLSLVEFVSVKYYQKESPETGQTIHTGMRWGNPELFAALEPQGLDPLDVLILIRRPGKILEDIGGNCGVPRKNLIESYWLIIFKRDTDPTPPQKILLNLRRHLYNCGMPRKNLIESYYILLNLFSTRTRQAGEVWGEAFKACGTLPRFCGTLTRTSS